MGGYVGALSRESDLRAHALKWDVLPPWLTAKSRLPPHPPMLGVGGWEGVLNLKEFPVRGSQRVCFPSPISVSYAPWGLERFLGTCLGCPVGGTFSESQLARWADSAPMACLESLNLTWLYFQGLLILLLKDPLGLGWVNLLSFKGCVYVLNLWWFCILYRDTLYRVYCFASRRYSLWIQCLCVCLTFCPVPEAYLGDGCWDQKCFVIHSQAQLFPIYIEKVLIQIATTCKTCLFIYICISLSF